MSSSSPGIVDRGLRALVAASIRFWWLGLALSAIVAVGGLWMATRLGLDADMKSLLPARASVVANINIITKKSAPTTDIRFVLEGGPLAQRLQAARAFSDFLKSQPDRVASVRFETPKGFLEQHKFLLIPLRVLKGLHAKVIAENKKIPDLFNPLDLDDEDDNQGGGEGEAKVETAAQTAAPEEEASGTPEAKVAAARADGTPAAPSAQPAPDAKSADAEMQVARDLLKSLREMRPYYQTADGKYLSIRIIPKAASFNIENNRRLIADFNKLAADFDFTRFHPDIRVSMHGAVLDTIEQYNGILDDVSFGIWGVLLIMVVVAVFFRSAWALLPTVPPLIAGLALGLACAALFERDLNTIAVFLILVVFGVGIEFGVHLWARMIQERRNSGVTESLLACWLSTGRATLTSSTALLAGFALLTLSSFQGFAQFGRVAIMLVIATAGSFVLFMPSWIIATERLRGSKPWRSTIADWLLEKTPQRQTPQQKRSPGRPSRVLRWVSLGISGAAIIACAAFLRFDYTFEQGFHNSNATPARRAMSEMYAGGRFRPSAMAVFDDQKQAAAFVEHFEAHRERHPGIALMMGLSMFLPVDQEERIDELQQIADAIRPNWVKKYADPEIADALLELKSVADGLAPITPADVPSDLRDPFVAADGSGNGLVTIFNIDGPTDGRRAMRFADALAHFESETGMHPIVSGPELIFADIVHRVTAEGPWLVLGMLLLVFLICWVDFRNLADASITLAPVLMGFLLTGLVMVLTRTAINFYNMVALASLGSMVVDNSIHMYHRFKELRETEPRPDRRALVTVGPTVVTCTITSILGYGGMVLANHRGISSLGFVAVAGLLLCLVSAVVFFPPWLELLARRRTEAQAPAAAAADERQPDAPSPVTDV